MIETMFSTREVPWHGLGIIVEDAPDSIAAIKHAGLDWKVNQQELYVNNDGFEGLWSGQGFDEIPNYKANVRSDNGKVLGIVTDRYQILQNDEAFEFTDALLSSGEVRYETAGSLKEGRQVWMLAKMNRDYSILGDKVDPYICFVNSHDGTGAVRALMTPVRVVCKNTLNMAIKQASRSWSTTHVGDVASKFSEAQRTLGLAETYLKNLNEEAHNLLDIKLSAEQINEFVSELIPMPVDERINPRATNNILMKRDALQLALRQPDIAKFNGTGWQIINAVSDLASHAEPVRRTGTFKENQFAKVVGGDSLFDKAYLLLKAVA